MTSKIYLPGWAIPTQQESPGGTNSALAPGPLALWVKDKGRTAVAPRQGLCPRRPPRLTVHSQSHHIPCASHPLGQDMDAAASTNSTCQLCGPGGASLDAHAFLCLPHFWPVEKEQRMPLALRSVLILGDAQSLSRKPHHSCPPRDTSGHQWIWGNHILVLQEGPQWNLSCL